LEIDLVRHQVRSPSRYWQPRQTEQWRGAYPDATERLRDEFVQSVQLHLRSDVPVAVMLSGGIDSSAVTMSARKSMGTGKSLDAFSYIGATPSANETKWIELIADAATAKVHRIEPDTCTLVADIERVIRDQQAPFGSLSIFAQHSVFRAVQAAGIKVILSGQGADELLGGYSPFVSARLASLVKSGRWWSAANYYGRGSRRWPGGKRLTTGLAQQLMPACIQRPIRKMIGKDAAPQWINKSWFLEREVSLTSIRDSRAGAAEPLKAALQDSLTRTNLPELLRYEDRNSMAHSVESRVPFLTTPLVSFLMSLPEHFIISDQCISKAIFRDAMRNLVPDPILDRQDKVAFSAPLKQWFPTLEPWIDETLHSETAARITLLDRESVLSHWSHVRSRKKRPDNLLWRWVNLIRWAEQYEVTLE
jgi:asparagine synthase (glutamine-hydrolysing)